MEWWVCGPVSTSDASTNSFGIMSGANCFISRDIVSEARSWNREKTNGLNYSHGCHRK